MYQNRARWYDPHTGRFISEDAVGDGTNLYRYSGNDPINFRDPTGLFQAGNPLNDLALNLTVSQNGGFSGNKVGPAPKPIEFNFNQIVPGAVNSFSGGFGLSNPTLTSAGPLNVLPSTPALVPSFSPAVSPISTSFVNTTPAQPTLSEVLAFGPSNSSFQKTASPFVPQKIDKIRARELLGRDTQFESVGAAFGSGLKTGGKAVTNASISAVTLGIVENAITVTQQDIDNGFNTSRLIAGVSTELLVGLGTGGLSRTGSLLGKTALAFDTASNAVSVGRGVLDASLNGLTLGNTLQIAGGTAGLGGNFATGGQALRGLASDASRARLSFDTTTLSSGGLGGAKLKFVPNPNGRAGNALTQAKTRAVELDLRARGFTQTRREAQFLPGAGGSGTTRFADVVGVNPRTGRSEIIQIGQTIKSNNQIPVIRERRALDDIIFSPTLGDKFPNSTVRFIDVNRPGVIQP